MAEQFGKYEIAEVIGQGAFGTVFRAVDSSLGRVVALKVLHPILMTDEVWVNRFRREGTAMARLHHPHIAVIYEIGELDGRLFIAMQYVPGPNLGQRLKEDGPLAWEEALRIAGDIAGALDHAHRAGVLHRDLKPENILLGPDGPVLTDFGVARLIGESRMGSTLSAGGVVGTPHYIAPEVWRGQPSTPAADTYALACIVAEMLTGKRLYDGPSTPAVMHAHFQPPELPAEWPVETPPGLSDVLQRALSQEPDARYAAAGEFASALAALDALQEPAIPDALAVAASAIATAPVASTVSTGANTVKPAGERSRPTLPGSQAEAQQPAGPSPRLLLWSGIIGAVVALLLCVWGLSALLNGAANGGTAVAAATATEPTPTDTAVPVVVRTATRMPAPPTPLPSITPVSTEHFVITHTVQAGETMTSIAELYEGVTAEALAAWNGITDPNAMVVGQVLIVPPQPIFTPTPTATLNPNNPPVNAELGDIWTRPADGMTMVYVPAGSFLMGSEDGDSEADSDEFPQHEVTLDSFWIDRTEVTNAQYERCVADGDCPTSFFAESTSWNGADYPVVGVSWMDAEAYCTWAGGRLPTEAEWEYAARGPEANRYPWGDELPTCELAQFASCDGETIPVGGRPAGASWVGALDMTGNVWEWVQDWYGSYVDSPSNNPTGPTEGDYKVLRGGSWGGTSRNVRSADRIHNQPENRAGSVGFRCALPQAVDS